MTPQFSPQWTVPKSPSTGERPIRGGMVGLGLSVAIAGHVVAAVVGIVGWAAALDASFDYVLLGVVAEIVLFAACLTISIVWIVKRDRGFGLGLLIGWAIGAVASPVVALVVLAMT